MQISAICPEGRVSSLNKSNPIQVPTLHAYRTTTVYHAIFRVQYGLNINQNDPFFHANDIILITVNSMFVDGLVTAKS